MERVPGQTLELATPKIRDRVLLHAEIFGAAQKFVKGRLPPGRDLAAP
jgi:hypothetical protein